MRHAIRRRDFLGLCATMTLGTLAACGGSNDATTAATTQAGGSSSPITIGETSVISSITPTDASAGWDLTSDGISESLYLQDENGNLTSRYVGELTQVDDLTWKATLNDGPQFSDGSAVDAAAVAACLNEVQASNAVSNSSTGKMTFEATGDLELTITTEQPTRTMDSVLCEWTNILYKKLDDGSYAFSGPYQIASHNPGAQIDLTPNPNYPDADRRSDVTIKAFKDVAAMQQAFESGEIDMAFTVTADVKGTLEAEGKTVTDFDAGYQYFAYLNTRRDALSDASVRQAINYGLNRDDMTTALKGGRTATGVFASYYPFAGTSEVTCDPDRAKKLLDDAGWVAGDDGVRAKDGTRLALKMVTYTSRPDLPVIMQLAASQLKDLGFDVSAQTVDAIDDTGKSGDFDVMFYAQHSAPTGNPVSYLSMTFKTGGAKNFTGYANPEFDALVDQMANLPNGEDLDQLAVQAQAMLFEDAPVAFLVDPQWHVALSDRVAGYKPYCGDYYVVNPQLGLDA